MKFVQIDMGNKWYFINPELVTRICVSKDMQDCWVYSAEGMVYNHGLNAEGTKVILEKFGLAIP